MHDVQAEAAYLQVVFHDDDETPRDFVVDLVRSVFSQSAAAARAFCMTIPEAIHARSPRHCFKPHNGASRRPDIRC
jgi:ATP-dependent Clp protease adapter protein ClpS